MRRSARYHCLFVAIRALPVFHFCNTFGLTRLGLRLPPLGIAPGEGLAQSRDRPSRLGIRPEVEFLHESPECGSALPGDPRRLRFIASTGR